MSSPRADRTRAIRPRADRAEASNQKRARLPRTSWNEPGNVFRNESMIPGMFSGLAGGALRLLPPEAAHRVAVRALAMGLGPNVPNDRHGKRMEVKVVGLTFPNPLGLAAGFDKDCEAMSGAFGLGFGFVEVGTITPLPQPGNPKPRVFRLPEDGAVINRYGFNNAGMDVAARRLERFRATWKGKGVLGVNIGANKDSKDRAGDYNQAAKRLAPFADYMVVNVSSPNTPGLRGLQEPELLAEVLDAAQSGMVGAKAKRPLFLKLSPDLDDAGLEAAIGVAVDRNCVGLIVSNTTIERPATLRSRHRREAGGLSGVPLFEKSTEMLFRCRKVAPKGIALIAAGGVRDAEAAYAKIQAGANLVQMYTGLALGYGRLPGRITEGLPRLLKGDRIP